MRPERRRTVVRDPVSVDQALKQYISFYETVQMKYWLEYSSELGLIGGVAP